MPMLSKNERPDGVFIFPSPIPQHFVISIVFLKTFTILFSIRPFTYSGDISGSNLLLLLIYVLNICIAMPRLSACSAANDHPGASSSLFNK